MLTNKPHLRLYFPLCGSVVSSGEKPGASVTTFRSASTATSVMLAHNHPGGLAEPSDNDNSLTDAVKKALLNINVALQECEFRTKSNTHFGVNRTPVPVEIEQ